ncbi:MAG: hypothetical protein JWM68_3298, partial [Verrucomicrobiales bacterium]|nr:hypothetical protein [Verrucomicrobiales bacterium]
MQHYGGAMKLSIFWKMEEAVCDEGTGWRKFWVYKPRRNGFPRYEFIISKLRMLLKT